jgi:hypothetical protein
VVGEKDDSECEFLWWSPAEYSGGASFSVEVYCGKDSIGVFEILKLVEDGLNRLPSSTAFISKNKVFIYPDSFTFSTNERRVFGVIMVGGRFEMTESTRDANLRLKSIVGDDLAAAICWRRVSSSRRVDFGVGVDILLLEMTVG